MFAIQTIHLSFSLIFIMGRDSNENGYNVYE